MLLRLAVRNVLRQKLRTGMTLAAIVFGVVGIVLAGGFIADVFIQLAEATIHSQTGHIQIFKMDFLSKGTRSPERFLIERPDQISAEIDPLPGVESVMKRLFFSGLLNNGKRDLAVIGEGIEPDKEARLGTFIQMTSGRQLTNVDRQGIIVGQGVAHALGLKPGSTVTLVLSAAEGAMNTLDFEVVGVFQSFSKDFDARAVRIPLGAAQELMQTAGANLMVISLKQTHQTEEAQRAIDAQLPNEFESKNWRQLSDFYEKTVQLYDRQFGVLQGIILVMVLLSVANSVNMSVFERQGEFGTMQAMGNSRSTVARLILSENAIIGVIGSILGVGLGLLAAWIISAIGIPMPPPPNANVGYTASIQIVPETLLVAALIGFASTLLAAILPAIKISRIPVVDALRENI
jgi:putative ABC transport system permease protein